MKMKSTIKGLLLVMVISVFSLSGFAQLDSTWNYNITGVNHIILVQNSTVINIDGSPAPTTDCYIGVFYDNFVGGKSCAGYSAWQGAVTNVTAWGDDGLTTTIKEGYLDGEEFQWKIYANGLTYEAVATYMPTMPSTNTFTSLSMSGILTLNAYSALNVEVVEWLSPLTGCGLSSSEVVTVSFRNDTLGAITQNFSLLYSIDSGSTWVTEIYTLGIVPYDTITYSFTQTADFSAFANNAGSIADTTYNVMFKTIFPDDIDSTDNELSFTVTNMVPPYTEISGISTDYCLYDNIQPITLNGIPAGGEFTGNGVQNGTLIPLFAGAGTHCVVYTYYDANTGCNGADTVCISLHTVPIVSIGGYSSTDLCQYETIYLTGNYSGGEFLGSPYLNPVTGEFTPLISGYNDITYAYTDANNCSDTSDIYVFHTNPLPSVSIDNLTRSYCADESNIILHGNPFGGTYSINSIAIGDSIFNPNTATSSLVSLGYVYTDINGCTDDFNVMVKVFNLPNVSFVGLEQEYCVFDDSVSLTGFPAAGEWTGTTWENWFNPNVDGVFSVVYSFTEVNQYYGDTAYCTNTDTHFSTVHPLPIVDLAAGFPTLPNGDIETADPDSTTLNAGNGFDYQWNTGSTSQTQTADYDWGYNVPGYGGYVVTVTDNHTCEGVDSIFIGGTDVKLGELLSPASNCVLTGNEDVIVSYLNNGTFTFEANDKITFKVNIDGVNTLSPLLVLSSQFAPGDTLIYTFPNPPTNIGDIATIGEYDFNIELDYQNGLNIPDVNPDNDINTFVVVNGGLPYVDLGIDFTTGLPDTVILDAGDFSSYLWNTGANTQTILVDLAMMTEYCVTVTDQFGCEAEDCIIVLDVEELPESFNKINLFPNPNNGQFTLVIENKVNSDIMYELFDVRGNIIFSDIKYNVNFIQEDIQLTGLAKGLYFLRINNGTDVNVVKIAIE